MSSAKKSSHKDGISVEEVGENPVGVAYDSTNGYTYVVNRGSGAVSVLNKAANEIATISLGSSSSPQNAAFDPLNGMIYVTENAAVAVINGSSNELVTTITGFSSLDGIAYDSISVH